MTEAPYLLPLHPNAASAGINLCPAHYKSFLQEKQPVAWLEIHAENFLNFNTPAFHTLERIRADYPVSIHAVNLSIGSSDGVDEKHVMGVKALIDRIQPFLISDHLAWARFGGSYFNSPLPLPYTQESLSLCATNLDRIQTLFERPLLIENPLACLQYADSNVQEADFLGMLVNRTGAGILLDLNSLYITCGSQGWDAEAYLKSLPARKIQEIHLSGHSIENAIPISNHGICVSSEVWELYQKAIDLFKPVSTLIEWYEDVPQLSVLLNEAAKAQVILDKAGLPIAGKDSHVLVG